MVDRSRRPRLAVAAVAVFLWTSLHAASPAAPAQKSAIWVGRAAQMEAHLRDAEVVGVEDIGTGVTNPKRAHLNPAEPFESFVWKPIPPGRPSGYWESDKSEIAAYELDKLLEMKMVPPAVQRTIDGDDGAAIMWIPGMESVKQKGGKMPTGAVWGRAIRADLWGRIQALQQADLERAVGPWIGTEAVRAALERRENMARAVDKLIKKKGRAAVIVQ